MNTLKYILGIILIGFSTLAFSQKVDTLRVKETDSLLFNKEIRPPYFCAMPLRLSLRKPKPITVYTLKNPQTNTYYYIYNAKNQLIKEGKYTENCVFNGQTYKGFCNFKTYHYTKSGRLKSIHYMQDGRNFKHEKYRSNRRLKQVIFYDKRTGEISKIENYKKGKLRETLVYNKNGYNIKIEKNETP